MLLVHSSTPASHALVILAVETTHFCKLFLLSCRLDFHICGNTDQAAHEPLHTFIHQILTQWATQDLIKVGLNYGQLTTCIVALYFVKFLSLGTSWLDLNDARDNRKLKSSISVNFGIFETGHSQFTWLIFFSILPLTLVLPVYEIGGN